jgi:hypothetical protein
MPCTNLSVFGIQIRRVQRQRHQRHPEPSSSTTHSPVNIGSRSIRGSLGMRTTKLSTSLSMGGRPNPSLGCHHTSRKSVFNAKSTESRASRWRQVRQGSFTQPFGPGCKSAALVVVQPQAVGAE